MTTESRELGGASTRIQFSNGTVIEGLAGVGAVRQRRPEAGRLRSAALPSELDTSAEFDRALADIGIREQETLVLDAAPSSAVGTDTIRLNPARPAGDDAPRVVLYQDESGGMSWHFAQAAPPRRHRPGLRAPVPGLSFVIPLREAASRTTLREGLPRRNLRGPITKVGRKIFKIFVLPIASALLADPVRWLGEQVERRCTRNLIWQVTPENYKQAPQQAFSDWQRLRQGPVLLLVHGIFSSVEGMLSGLPRPAMEDWAQRYDGRVLGFNHLTVSESPEDNARFLLQQLQQALPFDRITFDIVCHSRGGIVSRTLAERARELVGATAWSVRSVYFVATPNAGSPIGDADHMVDMIDLFTNCLTSFPDGPVTYSLEVLLGLVTLVGHAGARALPGIAALGTQGSYITDVLNRGTERVRAFYGAAAADFEPQPGRENGWLIDRLANPALDRVFSVGGRKIANDLVVPQQGVFAANGHPSFPIADPLVYSAGDGIWHTAFFAQPRTIEHIGAHLAAVAAATQVTASAARPGLRGPVAAVPAPAAAGAAPAAAAPGPIVLRSRKVPPATGRGEGSVRAGAAEGRAGAAAGAGRAGMPKRAAKSATTNGRPARKAAAKPPRKHAGRGTGAAAVADTTERDPKLDFPPRLAVGARQRLVVRLELPAAGPAPAERMSLVFEPGADEIELTAELSAPGFAVAGPGHAKLRILRERDEALEQAAFELTALDTGTQAVERRIVVSFYRGNELVGAVTHGVIVAPPGARAAAAGAATVSPLRITAQRRTTADLVVLVRRVEPGHGLYALDLRSQLPGAEYESQSFGQFDLNGQELAAYLSAALDPAFAPGVFPGDELSDADFADAIALWNADFMLRLHDLGKQLWLQLPQPFRDEYLRLAGLQEPARSIAIYSDELLLPWELVRPSGLVNGAYCELPPLGVSHVLGRWRPGVGARPQPQALPVASMAIVMPGVASSGLPWALQEASQLGQMFPFARTLSPVRRRQLDALLDGGDAQIVHFSGHGTPGANADLTALELEGGERIVAMAFAASRLGQTRQPLLYLNACTVGRGGRVLGRAGGFAGNCIASGWSGVVAPYWPVVDSEAAAFAVDFYAKLKAGRTIGEALCELRGERPDDPSAHSYAYFGDPFARVLFAEAG